MKAEPPKADTPSRVAPALSALSEAAALEPMAPAAAPAAGGAALSLEQMEEVLGVKEGED